MFTAPICGTLGAGFEHPYSRPVEVKIKMQEDQTALKQLCSWIMADIEADTASGQDILDFAISRLSDARKQEAIVHITEILDGNPSDAELEQHWFRNGALIGVVNPAFYRTLFQELKDRLAGKPAAFRF